jgi:hypothetical protein
VEAVHASEAVTVELIVEAANAQAVSEQQLSVHKPSAKRTVNEQAFSDVEKLSVHKPYPSTSFQFTSQLLQHKLSV